MKRGQVTVFIILGILLLIGVGFAIYSYSRSAQAGVGAQEHPVSTALSANALQTRVDECLARVGADAILLVAKQGGYVNPRGDIRLNEFGDGLSVHYYLQDSVVPYVVDKDELVARELPDVIDGVRKLSLSRMDECLDFSALEVQGYAVERRSEPQLTVSSLLADQAVLFSLSYPLTISGPQGSLMVDKSSVRVPLRLELVHGVAQEVARRIAQGPELVKLDDLCEAFAVQDGMVNVYQDSSPVALDGVVAVVDGSSVKQGFVPLRYQFAVRNKRVVGSCVG